MTILPPPKKNRNNNEHRTRALGHAGAAGPWPRPAGVAGAPGTRRARAHCAPHTRCYTARPRLGRRGHTESHRQKVYTSAQERTLNLRPPPFYGGGPGEPHSKVRKSYKEYRSSLVQSPTRRAFQPRARQHSSHAFFVAAALRQRQPSEAGVASHLGRAILGGAPRCPRAPQPAPSSLTRAGRAERAPQAPPLALPRGRPRALDRERAFYCIGRRRQRSRELRSPAGHPQAARQADRWAR